MTTNFGWVYDEERIAAATERLEKAGYTLSYDADRPQMRGFWERQKSRGVTRVLAQDDELTLNGAWRKSNHQARGTCVQQGSERAIEDVQISRLADKAFIGVYTQIAGEIMYGWCRNKNGWSKTHAWGCKCGNCPDGMTGVEAAEFFATKGVIRRANYTAAGIDLSQPREDLAIQWNNIGVPEVLIAAAAFHKIECHRSMTWTDYEDPIAAKNWGHVCLPQIFKGTRIDRFGCCEPDDNGGHCTECCGIVVLPSGETAFIMQQSWGEACKYPVAVQTVSGPVKLRPGSYAVRKGVLEGIGRQVELISCDIPSPSSFR
ncbi:hypothetical protein [Schlesneria sp. T3-172]|uniref:hypothetical protein n=1 Tax=Schlesneria sphaerica TaxID=3373610 RepID=UPI0037C7DA6D